MVFLTAAMTGLALTSPIANANANVNDLESRVSLLEARQIPPPLRGPCNGPNVRSPPLSPHTKTPPSDFPSRC